MPADQPWQVLTLPPTQKNVSSGEPRQMKVARSVAVLASGRTVYAILLLEGSEVADPARLQWRASCGQRETTKGMFVRNQALKLPGESRDDCTVAIGPIGLAAALRAIDADMSDVLEQHELVFDGPGYAINATVAQNGATLGAWLFARDSFKGSDKPPAAPLGATQLPPSVVQWALEMSSAVHTGTLSPSGQFVLPRIDFLEPASTVQVKHAAPVTRKIVLAVPSVPSAEDLCPNAPEVFKAVRYPLEACRARVDHGSAFVDFTLTPDGQVTDVAATWASHPSFVAESVAAVKRLQCKGKDHSVRVRVPFRFRLE